MQLEALLLFIVATGRAAVSRSLMNFTSWKCERQNKSETKGKKVSQRTHGIHLYVYFTSVQGNNLFLLLIKPCKAFKMFTLLARNKILTKILFFLCLWQRERKKIAVDTDKNRGKVFTLFSRRILFLFLNLLRR